MKRTKSMIYKPSEEARELLLVATNESKLYTSMIVPIVRNLARKMSKGVFNADKAIDAFYYVADAASKQYHKDFGYLFTVTERFTAAGDMVMLFNLYTYVKENDIQNDFINYDGKNKDDSSGRV